MVKKIAITLGIIIVVGVIIVALTTGIKPFLNEVWTWIFRDVFKFNPPPPAPFS